METEHYLAQRARWPERGRHVLAHYDEHTIVVYQAYGHAIAQSAVAQGHLGGGGWSAARMSWVKPNFLWMMYRAGWATKDGQEHVLALRVPRPVFDAWLAAAVHSKHVPEVYADARAWSQAVARSHVRLQWDPDHDPHGNPCARRAIQLGLRGPALAQLADPAHTALTDVTDLVRAQHAHVRDRALDRLELPLERVYPVGDPAVAARLGIE